MITTENTYVDSFQFVCSRNNNENNILDVLYSGKRGEITIKTRPPEHLQQGIVLTYWDSLSVSCKGHRRNSSLPVEISMTVKHCNEEKTFVQSTEVPLFKGSPNDAMIDFVDEKSHLLACILRLFSRTKPNHTVPVDFQYLSAFLEAAVYPVLQLMPEKNKADILAGLISRSFCSDYVKLLIRSLSELIINGYYENMLRVFTYLPVSVQIHQQVTAVRDFTLCCVVQKHTQLRVEAAENNEDLSGLCPWKYIPVIADSDARCHCLLGCMKYWPVEVCVELLKMCCTKLPRSPNLHKMMKLKLRDMNVYKKVIVIVYNYIYVCILYSHKSVY